MEADTTDTPQGAGTANTSTESIHFVVGVNQSAATPDITPAVRHAAAFWETQASAYNETYNATFAVRPDAADPDLLVNDYLLSDCGDTAAGCADTVQSLSTARRVDKPINVYMGFESISNERNLRYMMKHEFGHVLGATHCERPYWLLGCPKTDEYETRSYKTAESPWRISKILVHVDTENSTQPVVEDVLDTYRTSEQIPADMTIETVATEWNADIVISGSVCASRGCGSIQTSASGGHAYDSDDNLEFLYDASVRAEAYSEDRLNVAVGRGLGSILTPTERPPKYRA